MAVKYIDPPGGWKYGFPKVIPDDVTDIKKWLIDNEYPKVEIDSWAEHFYYRMWEM